jgi:uncharacterized membrane protein
MQQYERVRFAFFAGLFIFVIIFIVNILKAISDAWTFEMTVLVLIIWILTVGIMADRYNQNIEIEEEDNYDFEIDTTA